MKTPSYILIAASLAFLAACETEPKEKLSPSFGNAVKHNMAVQIINPEGSPAPVEPVGLGGDRALKAYSDMLKRESGPSGSAPMRLGISGAAAGGGASGGAR